MRRAVRPDTGTITFDSINIYDFDSETYKHNLSYVTNKPYFFNDTIIENLRVVETNKKRIVDACKKVGIHNKIESLEDGYETNLNQKPTALNSQEKFLLGLARALLTKSEIFIIYEFPVGLSQEEQETIKKIISSLKNNRTILIFSALNPVDDIIDRHFFVEKGVVTEQKVISTKRSHVKNEPEDTTNSSPSAYFEGKLSN